METLLLILFAFLFTALGWGFRHASKRLYLHGIQDGYLRLEQAILLRLELPPDTGGPLVVLLERAAVVGGEDGEDRAGFLLRANTAWDTTHGDEADAPMPAA